MDAMEYIVKHTQKVNKKYIPKKYRKESEWFGGGRFNWGITKKTQH
jgi:hypothetical protein